MRRRAPHCAGRGGFTLIELLAVIVILGILVAFLVDRLGDSEDIVKARLTEVRMQSIGAEISSYELEHGDWPHSSWQGEWGPVPDTRNIGIECLVAQLWSPDAGGTLLKEEYLDNTDGDSARKSLTTFQSRACFEIVDEWRNPIAYFHNRDYGREDLYATFNTTTGDPIESKVKSLTNSLTGNPYQPRKFQLISAGVDGMFGTDDDLTTFGRRDG